jgi:uncharacterized membrane protein YhaH (DUF805 family)
MPLLRALAPPSQRKFKSACGSVNLVFFTGLKMGYLFGFRGRIGRGEWWLGQLAVILIITVGFFTSAFALLQAFIFGDGTLTEVLSTPGLVTGAAILVATWILAAVVQISVCVKRYHDRDKSGFWCLPLFVPYLGVIWGLGQIVTLGMMRGTSGPNRFDTDDTPRGRSNDYSNSSDGGYADIDSKIAAMKSGAYLAAPTAAATASYRMQRESNTSPIQRNPGFGRRGLN